MDGTETLVGSRTECALLQLLRVWGTDYNSIREAYSGKILKVCYASSGATWGCYGGHMHTRPPCQAQAEYFGLCLPAAYEPSATIM